MLNIKILGPGCANCRKLEAVARDAASVAGVQAEFEKVSDMKQIMRYDLLSTPGLVINEMGCQNLLHLSGCLQLLI